MSFFKASTGMLKRIDARIGVHHAVQEWETVPKNELSWRSGITGKPIARRYPAVENYQV
jgi:hypothetical protein